MLQKINFLLISFFLISCTDKQMAEKTSNCDYSIYYHFIGLISNDSLNQPLPKALNVDFNFYDAVLTIKNCQGKADLVIYSDDGKIIGKGSYSEADKLEELEVGNMDLSFNIVVDTIQVYYTSLDGTWNFNKIKYKSDENLYFEE